MSSQQAVLYFQEAENLKQQRRFAEAEAQYRSALAVEPRSSQFWCALGDLYAQTENFAGVETCCRRVIDLNPAIPEVHLYLGMALQRQARLEEAGSALRAALDLNPALAEARYELGIVQQSLGKVAAAIENYRAALKTIQEPAPLLYNLSILYAGQGRTATAFQYASDALQAQPASLKYARQFVRLLNAACPTQANPRLLAQISDCFDLRGLDTAPLMKPCMVLFSGDPDIRRAVGLALHETPQALETAAARGAFDRLFGNELLYKTLLHTKIASPEFEILLCALRRLALAAATATSTMTRVEVFRGDGRFAEALACQFFNTDYAAYADTAEAAAVSALADRLAEDMRRGIPADPSLLLRIAVYCMYRPLNSLDGVEQVLAGGAGRIADALPLVVKQHWEDLQTERTLQDGIETLTAITAGVSSAVRTQYEESPYPRWFSVDLYEPVSYREMLKSTFPYFDVPDFGGTPLNILVAGCGTGRHAMMVATRFTQSDVLAIDLSLASLAYAKRKALESNITNIRFAHADILKLDSLGHRFHIIESMGVLHHMKDPQTGLKVLTGLLVEGGLMWLGLYSASGRRAVAAARQYIAEQAFATTPDGIRAARKALLALDPMHPAYRASRFRDFYTRSECRDLLFHVQEHCLSIPELAAMLNACGLRFLGFTPSATDTLMRYRARYPDDPDMTDLSHWHEFEQANPDTFEEMYQFWCHKI